MLVETILHAKGTEVHTVPVTASIGEAVAVLNTQRIGAVVVTAEDGSVAGILSERDVVRHLGTDPAGLLGKPVTACMTAKVVTVTSQSTIAEIMERMTQSRIRHIPVVEEGRLVGIVSIGDVVKRKIEETEQEASALRDYISS